MLAEGEPIEFEPSSAASVPAAVAHAGAAVKRGTLRVVDALMPRGK
jgi:hypothetical protein